MKGLILAAGEGKRLTELQLRHKALAEIKKKCIINYSLDMLCEVKSAICEIIIVVGYHAEDIVKYLGNNYKGIPIKYVVQEKRLGIAHAVKTARDLINDDFILCLADEILINNRIKQMICEFNKTNNVMCMCGAIFDKSDKSMKPIAYDLDENGRIAQVREKPEYYSNDIRGIGECIFTKAALDQLDYLQPNLKRGEYEMGDWIQLLIQTGGNVEVFDLADDYINVNRIDDFELANRIV